MILESLSIASFAGTASRTIDFQPGMNIVYGPNEAGKSSIFAAIEHLCLTSSKMTPIKFQRTLGPLVPVGGGDTLMVSARFLIGNDRYGLDKRWGGASGVELHMPDGGVVSDDAAVERIMKGLLPASPAALRSVLLARQSGIDRILGDLKASREPLLDLRELFRRAMHGGDGIPVDRFRAQVETEVAAYFGRWDRRTDGPEQGRGFANPWKQGRGRILESWYAVERLKGAYEELVKAEDSLAELATRLRSIQDGIDEAERFIGRHKDAAEGAVLLEKSILEQDEIKRVESEYLRIYDEWPKTEERGAKGRALLKKRREESGLLGTELEGAKRYLAARDKLREIENRIKKAVECTEALEAARAKREGLTVVDNAIFDELRSLRNRAEEVRRALLSGTISLSLTAGEDLELELRKNIEPPEPIRVMKGEVLDLRTEGALSLRHPGWHIRVQPGESDYDELTVELDKLNAEFERRLKVLNVVSIDEAGIRRDEYNEVTDEIRIAKRLLDDVLQGATLEELRGELGPKPDSGPPRSIEEIVKAHTTVGHEIRSLEIEMASLEETLDNYRETYGKRDTLLDLLLETRAKGAALRKRIAGLPELPAGFTNWQELREAYSGHRDLREELLAERSDLRTRKAALEALLPDVSGEEIALELEEAQAAYRAVRKDASALERILEKSDELLAESGIDFDNELKTAFDGYFSHITGRRYEESRFEDELPAGIVRGDGKVLSYDQLSGGTRDGFALALRLAMAGYFLEEKGGFLLMDDPFVDMDDQHRVDAAAVLRGFSQRAQTIVFTCHPDHAALFESTKMIRLDTE